MDIHSAFFRCWLLYVDDSIIWRFRIVWLYPFYSLSLSQGLFLVLIGNRWRDVCRIVHQSGHSRTAEPCICLHRAVGGRNQPPGSDDSQTALWLVSVGVLIDRLWPVLLVTTKACQKGIAVMYSYTTECYSYSDGLSMLCVRKTTNRSLSWPFSSAGLAI